ncbi:hypothetical protein [Paenibacillus sp. YYML68]|uniref:hypothetical protein n=1 Tax=Paenibacillus sp. YYML68 TaxID=2909250 RepID=UPI0024937C9B|nr:hypothetical protein [Paenibacillus sp. YYML68]
MTKQLKERKKALQSVRKRLHDNASLRSDEGRQYIRCLAMLVTTEMQIEEHQSMKKDACQRPQ